MKKLFLLLPLLLSINFVFAQKKVEKKVKEIVAEGKALYRSEMASWHGTDLFIAQYQDKSNIGGYLSYASKKENICIFFSKSTTPKVIGQITFDNSFDLNKAKINFNERALTKQEESLRILRAKTIAVINADTLFKTYNNTNLNIIPIIQGKQRKVYILTGPKDTGVVLFGNDYLLTFNKKNELISKKALHKKLTPVFFNNEEVTETPIHSIEGESVDMMTPTDVCTLMLYAKYTNWKQYQIVSPKYLSTWNCLTNSLYVLEMDVVKKIAEDQKTRNGKE